MKNRSKWFALFALLSGLIVSVGAWRFWSAFVSPGRTKEETARILVHDLKLGGRAKERAIGHGNDILPSLQSESSDFADLNGRNSFWIAEVLGSIRTQQSRSILTNLYSRTNRTAKLVGAVGLLQQGAYPDQIDSDSILVQTVTADPNQTETQLAIIALGKSKHTNALPCLLDLLRRQPLDYWHHAHACDAVARIGSKEAIPVLIQCLKSEQFHALPNAFRALIALGDKNAVRFAIDRISPEIKSLNSGAIVTELKKVTGKSFGYNREAWQKWWNSAEPQWEIPKDFLVPWDEQKPVY
ncbi:MAG: HEAT repeat domain-containing protein [Limisphaerales bacterium]